VGRGLETSGAAVGSRGLGVGCWWLGKGKVEGVVRGAFPHLLPIPPITPRTLREPPTLRAPEHLLIPRTSTPPSLGVVRASETSEISEYSEPLSH